MKRPLRVVFPTILCCLLPPTAGAADRSAASIRELLRQRVERIAEGDLTTVAGARLVAVRLIPELYERRGFAPVWIRPQMIDELMATIRSVGDHGLAPEDYHLVTLAALLRERPQLTADPGSRADLDILLTDAFARLAYTLHFGKLDPADLHPEWNYNRRFTAEEPLTTIAAVLDLGEVAGFLSEAVPATAFYQRLLDALARYRRCAEQGGWPMIPGGGVLEPGDRSVRVPVLRERLHAIGRLDNLASPHHELYDDRLTEAVRGFQRDHALAVDGAVGARTLAALNVPVQDRIDQIRANLERVRWVFRDVEDRFVVVNIAGFILHVIDNGAEVWSTRVQVGTPYHTTPVFRDRITYLVFNPTWTVPQGILRKEVLPAVRRDPGYLTANHMVMVDRRGRVLDPDTVDLSTNPFPYTIRQEPGPANALGRVKFMFPNPYQIYLHDTPSKRLFERAGRAFSHGCIRVEDPLRLAELVLADTPGWDRVAIDRVVESYTTTTVTLAEPLPIMLQYWTVEVDDAGRITFFQDPYGRDEAVVDGLAEELRAPSETSLGISAR